MAEGDGRDWPVVTIGGCVIGTVRATLWEISPQKKYQEGRWSPFLGKKGM